MHSVDCAQASLQEQRHCRSSGSCRAELWPGPGSRPGSAGALGSHGEHLSEQCQVWMVSPPMAQPRAAIHSLWTDERLRVPRRRRQAQQPAPGMKHTLSSGNVAIRMSDLAACMV